ncbi:hypothetical protein PIB30_084018 [Stylosanthes scabra]|uniref:Uncharacterized protein n=1 Tax=Stylosanthes scabra TaxID=79078 RepID=A0ABU6WQS2_9FABA|nr:hypothetical protein [Stylosanthes scabra]
MDLPMEPKKRAEPRTPSSQGPRETSSGLERQSASQGSASQGSKEDKLVEMLANVQKKLDDEQRVNAEARKEHSAKLDSMVETVVCHGMLPNTLMKRLGGTASSDSVSKRCTRSRSRRGHRSGVSKRGRGRGASQPPLVADDANHARKLQYNNEVASDDEDLGGWIEGIGNPETYYNHISIWVEGVPLPKAIELEFPLPQGLFFAGMELAVASYIFGKGLLMG